MNGANEADLLALFRARGALLEGHFQLSSGRHADRFLQSQVLMADPVLAAMLADALAVRLRGLSCESVLGPALAGIVWAHELARALGCRSLFAERQEGRFALRRGQALRGGERVLVAENVVTTGGSVREVMEVVAAAGALAVGVAALVDRGPEGARPFGELPFGALVRLDVPTYDPAECPRCRRGEPVESPGSRHRLLSAGE